MEPIDLESLRRQAREQMNTRRQPHIAWVNTFEMIVREELAPRAELFRKIMSSAGNPGLKPRALDTSGLSRGWVVGIIRCFSSSVYDQNQRWDVLCLCPGILGFQSATVGSMMEQSTDIVVPFDPQESTMSGGEIVNPSAVGQVARILFKIYQAQGQEKDPWDEAREYSRACDRRMLALLCANELTFPDRDLSSVAWGDWETALVAHAEQVRSHERKLAQRKPMTVEQVAQWLMGKLTNEEEYVVPAMTGRDLARALSLTSIEPVRFYNKKRFGRTAERTRAWKVERLSREMGGEMEQDEQTITYIRSDGTGFREFYHGGTRSAPPPVVTEFEAGYVHRLDLFRLQFLARQGESY